jgi:hypothetical protein
VIRYLTSKCKALSSNSFIDIKSGCGVRRRRRRKSWRKRRKVCHWLTFKVTAPKLWEEVSNIGQMNTQGHP